MDQEKLENRLIYALEKVTYSHAGLDDVLAQLFAVYGDFDRDQTGYKLGREIPFQKKAQLIEALVSEKVSNGELSDEQQEKVRTLLKKARELTAERNKCVHDLYDVMWRGTDIDAPDREEFVIRTSPKVGKGSRLEEVDVEVVMKLGEDIFDVAKDLARIAHAQMTE